MLVTDLSSLKHSARDSLIRGPSHALTLVAWNLTHLWAVALCSHWSANSLHLNFLLLLQKKVTQNCCQQMHFRSSQCLKMRWRPDSAARTPLKEHNTPQFSYLDLWGPLLCNEEWKRKRNLKELGREKARKERGRKSRGKDGGEGQGWKGDEKENLTLYSFVSLRAPVTVRSLRTRTPLLRWIPVDAATHRVDVSLFR